MIFKKIIPITILALISICIFLVGFIPKENYAPKVLYQVYLEGKKIGLINNKEELEEYINKEQTAIKKKYNIDKVYTPEGLEIKKILTHNNDVKSTKEIYNNIKDLKSFTIEGYTISIKGEGKTEYIYTLDKKMFEDAIDRTVKAFVDVEKYDKYINSKQDQILSTGIIIEDITILEKVTIKKDYIPTDKKIFTNTDELTKYIIYGTVETQNKYIIKDGDSISQIAFNNKLSVNEFLVANPEFTSANVILLEGQQVNVGLINPKITLSEKTYVVADETRKFTTEVVYDKTMYAGTSYVKQEGENGLNRVSKRIININGEATSAEILNTQELKPAVNRVVVRGDKYAPNIGSSDNWTWPTTTPYVITTYYGYRWGQMHAAIDIAGTGYNSPIYASNNGNVEFAGYQGSLGNYVLINHNNGYYTQYAHLSRITVKAGQRVTAGQYIGGMGNSGFVVGRTGIHLHYAVWYGGEPYRGGRPLDPLKVH